MAERVDETKHAYRVSAPADVEFELRDPDSPEEWKLYRVSGDPDVEIVATLLEIEEALRGNNDRELAVQVVRGRDLLLALIRDRMPEIEKIKIGVGGLMQVIALITGNESAAQEVSDALTDLPELPEEDDEEAAEIKRAEAEAGETGEEAAAVPLDRRSRKSSSRSGGRNSGARTGGEAAPGESSASSSTKRRAAAG